MRGYFSVSPSDPTALPRMGPTLRLRGEGLDHSSLKNWAAEPLLGLEVTLRAEKKKVPVIGLSKCQMSSLHP